MFLIPQQYFCGVQSFYCQLGGESVKIFNGIRSVWGCMGGTGPLNEGLVTLLRVSWPLLVPTNIQPSHVAPSSCLHVAMATPKQWF